VSLALHHPKDLPPVHLRYTGSLFVPDTELIPVEGVLPITRVMQRPTTDEFGVTALPVSPEERPREFCVGGSTVLLRPKA